METIVKEETKEALKYYIIPHKKVAIPKGKDSFNTLNRYLVDNSLHSLPSTLDKYPLVTRLQLRETCIGFEILPLIVEITTITRPSINIAPLTPLQVATRACEKLLISQHLQQLKAVKEAKLN